MNHLHIQRNRYAVADLTQQEEPMIVEVNWNDKVRGCKAYKFIWQGKEIIVDAKNFESLLFTVGSEKVQNTLLSMQQDRAFDQSAIMEVPIVIKTTRDVRSGELIKTTARINIPDKIKEYYSLRYQKYAIR